LVWFGFWLGLDPELVVLLKLHRDARLTLGGRALLVDRVENVVGDKLTDLGDLHAEAPPSCARLPRETDGDRRSRDQE
jgi:hypothetical protein